MSLAGAHNAMAAGFATSAAAMFPDLCTVRSAQAASSGTSGGKVKGSTSVHADVPCLYRPLSGSERSAGAVNAFADYEILMPAEVAGDQIATLPKHQIVVAARGAQSAKTFEVVSVLNVSGVYLKCEAVLKNG